MMTSISLAGRYLFTGVVLNGRMVSMINFECSHCGNPIKVPDQAAGRKGTCNNCGELVLVPNDSVVPPTKLVRQKSDEVTSLPAEAGKKKSLGKTLIAIFVCIFMLINTPVAPLPLLAVSLFCMFILVLTGVVETPKRTLERKKMEANEEAREISRYRNLSDEGKLIYDLHQKQAGTERYARGIFWFLMAGAIASIVFWLLAVLGSASR